ncbi:MAG: SH3 domain-containing protein, partial [Clostridia bacterium]|nr:SH3 domain-containing protein [Clostridia bacterium]
HVVTAASLNVRSGPSTDYESIGAMANAQRFNALEVVNEKWARINYFGQTGYISLNPSYVTRLTVADSCLGITDPTDLVFDSQRMADWGNSMISSDSGALLCQDDQGIVNTEFYTWQASGDPMAYLDFSNTASFFIDDYTHVSIVAKTKTPVNTTAAALFLTCGELTNPNEANVVYWNWIDDGNWHEYVIDISSITNHTGQLNHMRFDFFNDQTAELDTIFLRSIRFMKSDSKPTVTPSHTAIAEGRNDMTFDFSGMDNYFDGNDYKHPYMTIMSADDNLTKNGTSLIWNYVPASGTMDMATRFQGDYAGKALPAGKYKVYLTYNTAGSVNFFHALYMASPTAIAEFTVVGDTTGAELIDGITVNDQFATGAIGTNAKDAADKYTVALGGAKGYITDANGNALAAGATLASGMKLTVDGTSYDVVVEGDVDGNGGINIVDVQKALEHLRGTNTLDGAAYEALAMVNGSADCNILAATALLNQVLGL